MVTMRIEVNPASDRKIVNSHEMKLKETVAFPILVIYTYIFIHLNDVEYTATISISQMVGTKSNDGIMFTITSSLQFNILHTHTQLNEKNHGHTQNINIRIDVTYLISSN